jgi:hypothetical protein
LRNPAGHLPVPILPISTQTTTVGRNAISISSYSTIDPDEEYDEQWTMNITSGACFLSIQYPEHGYDYYRNHLAEGAMVYLVDCQDGVSYISFGTESSYSLSYTQYPTDHILFLAVVNETQTFHVSAVICEPSYRFGSTPVTLPYYQNSSAPQIGTPPIESLGNITGMQIMLGTLNSISGDNGPKETLLVTRLSATTMDLWFSLMNSTNPQQSFSSWLNADLITSTAIRIYSSLTAQLARSGLTVPSNNTVTGSIEGTAMRLQVDTLSFGLMTGFLCLAILMTIILIFSNVGAVSRDPTTIGAVAAILARSREFVDELEGKEGRISS